MYIGFDGKRAVSNMTGLGNYSRLVIERLALENPQDKLLVYTPAMRDNPRLETIRSAHNVEFRLPPPQGFKGSLWRTFGISNNLKADKVDIFHGLSNELPLNIRKSGVPSVVTMHDVIYRTMPECYKPIDRKLYDFKYGASCRNADRIIAVSERTKQDVVKFYGVDPDRTLYTKAATNHSDASGARTNSPSSGNVSTCRRNISCRWAPSSVVRIWN